MLLLALALACGQEDTGAVIEQVAVPVQRQDGVAYIAPVRRAPMALPPRYHAPLATGLEGTDDRLPPRDWYAHRVCRGDPQRDDWWGAVSASAAHLPAEELVWYGSWVHYCHDPGWCSWVRERLGDEATLPSARPLLQGQLLGCAGAGDLLQGAPADAVVSWYELHPSPWDPVLARAVEEVVAQGELWPARRAALVLGGVPDARAAEVLVRLHQEAPSEGIRDAVAAGLHSQDSPEARQRFAAYCARPVDERDLICDGGGLAWMRPEHRLAAVSDLELGDAVRDFRVEPSDLAHLDGSRERAATAILRVCAVDPQGSIQLLEQGDTTAATGIERCLAALALIDRTEAVWAAGEVAEVGGELTPLAARLVAWPDLTAARARLAELGLVGPEVEPLPAVEPLELMVGSGRGRWVDGEHWSHASMARELTPLVGLEGLSFEEIAPLYDDAWMPVGEGLFWLHAYDDGPWRISAPARDWGDWLDTDQVVGLLNAVLEHRGAPERLVVAQGWDGPRAVVGGLGMSLEAAAADGLLEVVAPEGPPDAGLGGALEGLLR